MDGCCSCASHEEQRLFPCFIYSDVRKVLYIFKLPTFQRLRALNNGRKNTENQLAVNQLAVPLLNAFKDKALTETLYPRAGMVTLAY